jgi:hypothetical protein
LLSGLLFGRTVLSLSGILSRPSSPLSSRPPEVDVPLPLRLGFIALPVVGALPGVAELAAGSPLVDPRPLGAPAAWASFHSASLDGFPTAGRATANMLKAATAISVTVCFISTSFNQGNNSEICINVPLHGCTRAMHVPLKAVGPF